MLSFLEPNQISPGLLKELQNFRDQYPVPESLLSRVPDPHYCYYGREIWEEAVTALLCGENLLLTGSKATGKNVLAENLAAVFGRPSWDVSFHGFFRSLHPARIMIFYNYIERCDNQAAALSL